MYRNFNVGKTGGFFSKGNVAFIVALLVVVGVVVGILLGKKNKNNESFGNTVMCNLLTTAPDAGLLVQDSNSNTYIRDASVVQQSGANAAAVAAAQSAYDNSMTAWTGDSNFSTSSANWTALTSARDTLCAFPVCDGSNTSSGCRESKTPNPCDCILGAPPGDCNAMICGSDNTQQVLAPAEQGGSCNTPPSETCTFVPNPDNSGIGGSGCIMGAQSPAPLAGADYTAYVGKMPSQAWYTSQSVIPLPFLSDNTIQDCANECTNLTTGVCQGFTIEDNVQSNTFQQMTGDDWNNWKIGDPSVISSADDCNAVSQAFGCSDCKPHPYTTEAPWAAWCPNTGNENSPSGSQVVNGILYTAQGN